MALFWSSGQAGGPPVNAPNITMMNSPYRMAQIKHISHYVDTQTHHIKILLQILDMINKVILKLLFQLLLLGVLKCILNYNIAICRPQYWQIVVSTIQGIFDYDRFCNVSYEPDEFGLTSDSIRYRGDERKAIVSEYVRFLHGAAPTEQFLRDHGFVGVGPLSPMQNLLDEMTLVRGNSC